MEDDQKENSVRRVRMFTRGCIFAGALIFGRLTQLQLFQHETYKKLSQDQQERNVRIYAPRGVIYDRRHEEFAMSVTHESVCVNPVQIPDIPANSDLLARALNLDRAEIMANIETMRAQGKQFLWIKREISTAEASRLRSLKLWWVYFRSESKRFYPKGTAAAHVLGGVDIDERGSGGIERARDKELLGEPGLLHTASDVGRRVFESEVRREPKPGKSITLTIDERMQNTAESELEKAVREHGATTGSIVIMDPKTGEIYAMANYPTFNPNDRPKTKADIESPARRNLCVLAPFEPGSAFKVFTLAAALDMNLVTPDTLFDCQNGSMTLFRRVIHDAHPHGTLSVSQVLERSSNIGSIKIALKLGNDLFYKYINLFGFGHRTLVGLPGEQSGILRPLRKWIPSSIGSVAMGHEISTTTLQLAQGCSAIANGGLLVQPHLVLGEPQRAPIRVLRAETANKMRFMMRGVVHNDRGTGKRARLDAYGYSAGGKTGSAQIYDFEARAYTHRYNATFMGFAPANDPRVVVVVTLNNTRTGNAGFGGAVAAPVFREVASTALRFLNVPKDLPDGFLLKDDGKAPGSDLAIAGLEGAIPPEAEMVDEPSLPAVLASTAPGGVAPFVTEGPKVPNYQGKTLRDVLQESSAVGIDVEAEGSGLARQQIPVAGSFLRRGEKVRVHFAR